MKAPSSNRNSCSKASTTTTSKTIADNSHRIAKILSGSCLCKSIRWTLNDVAIGQVLICHCAMCRRTSGSTNIPFVAVPRDELWENQLRRFESHQEENILGRYQGTPSAARYFCRICSSLVCMEYLHESKTLWVPLGALEDFDSKSLLLDDARDCHIFKEEEASYEGALGRLTHQEGFGTYKNDVCSGKPWDELTGWRDPK